MNIGILSMQRVNNYGSFLQALSLKNILEEMGNSVEFIDIIPGKRFEGTEFKDNGKKDWSNEQFVNFRKKRNDIISEHSKKYLNLSDEYNYKNHYDFAIIGSDEVFSCIGVNVGCSLQLFGTDVSKYTISYAASCGHTDYEQIQKYNLQSAIQSALINLKNISVRDKNTVNFIKQLTGKEPLEHIDPVFIYDFDKYLPKHNFENQKYIIIYSYDYRLNNKYEVDLIKKFAKKKHLKTIGVGLYQPWCDENINVTPFELLQYFKNASYVITDTFHGAVFSIKCNKKFAGISRSSNSYKFDDLLERFNLTSQKVSHMEHLEEILENTIDYDSVNKFIEEQTHLSINYFKKELQKAKEIKC